MKITLSNLFNLVQSFGHLGGRHIEATDGDRKVVIVKPYEFDKDGRARYAVVRNKAAAKIHMEAIETEREALNAKHGNGQSIKQGAPEMSAFLKDMGTFLKAEVEFAEHRIKIADLNIGINQLDTGIIEGLLPILDGEI